MPRKGQSRLEILHHAACPDEENHTLMPSGYVARSDWFIKMSKTHHCQQCPTCGFYVVWVPKEQENKT